MKLEAPECCGLGSLLIMGNLCNLGKQIMQFWFDHTLKLNNSIKFCLSSTTTHFTGLELYYIPNSLVVLNYTFRQSVHFAIHSTRGIHRPRATAGFGNLNKLPGNLSSLPFDFSLSQITKGGIEFITQCLSISL
jgi:hypothetical protein